MMSEDEAAGLRKQLIRFHCISCDRPIDVQPHAFVFNSWFVFALDTFILDNNRVFPLTKPCVQFNHRDLILPMNWTRFVSIRRGNAISRMENIPWMFCFAVSNLVMNSVVVVEWRMFMQLFDNVVVLTRQHYHLNDKSNLSKMNWFLDSRSLYSFFKEHLYRKNPC